MRRLTVVLMLALGAIAVRGQQPARSNVLLVTIDAFRADRATSQLTPTIAAMAARGTRFDRAYSHAPLTLPAHASLLTGLLPPAHGVRNNGFRLDSSVTTLAELLAKAGYATGAFVGGSALDARFGLARGFEKYDDLYDLLPSPASSTAFRQGARPAPSVLAAASAWLANQREPWFAWAHLREPHAPYVSYDAAVTAADTALGGFLTLVERKLLDRTLIVVTGDHGESLGEHGERTHGVFAYESVLRVPLVIVGPGAEPRVVSAPVSHVDIAPTLLALLGLEAPAFDGQSLVPLMRGTAIEPRVIYFEALDAALMRGGAPLTGVIDFPWKWIDLPAPELYALDTDPKEQTNRASTDQAIATRLRDLTVSLRTASPRADAAAGLAEPSARARLRSLGYVGSASWRLGASRVEDDPKRLLPLHLAYESAIDTAGSDPEAAIRQLGLIVEQRPDFAAAVDAQGALMIAQGRSKEAIALLNDARAGGLRQRVLAERLAAALLAARDPRSAVMVLQPVVQSDLTAADARFLLARAYNAIGNASGAQEQLKAALAIDPTFAAASDLLARIKASGLKP